MSQRAVIRRTCCARCRYDLRGIASERCPECGVSAIDRSRRRDHAARVGVMLILWLGPGPTAFALAYLDMLFIPSWVGRLIDPTLFIFGLVPLLISIQIPAMYLIARQFGRAGIGSWRPEAHEPPIGMLGSLFDLLVPFVFIAKSMIGT